MQDETLLADIPAVHMALERRFRKPWAEVAAKFTKGGEKGKLGKGGSEGARSSCCLAIGRYAGALNGP